MSARLIATVVALVATFGLFRAAVSQEPPDAPVPRGETRSRDEPDAARSRERGDERGAPREGRDLRVEPRLLPPGPWPSPGRPQRWRLGVYVDNRDTGVLLTQVVPFSAAARAGLEPGDVVVTAGGYQVGIVEGRLYDLGDELHRRADYNGLVRLLILDRRNGLLANRDVQLEPAGGPVFDRPRRPGRPSGINGSVTYRERIALPADAELVVRLVQAPPTGGRGGRPGVLGGPTPVISERTIRNPGQVPIEFELPLDPSNLRPGGRYTVEAEITAGGRPMFRGSTFYEPERRGGQPSVDIELESVGRVR